VPDPELILVGILAVVSAWCVVAALRELREVFRAR
jgi:hypothetical protein